MKGLIQYFYEIKLDKAILWCYFIWYLVVIYFYFDPSLKIWINSIGISAVIGTGLLLSVSSRKTSKKDPCKRSGYISCHFVSQAFLL